MRVEWLGKAGRASIAFGLQTGRFSTGISTGLQGESVCWGMGSVCLNRIAAYPWLVKIGVGRRGNGDHVRVGSVCLSIAADPSHEKRRCLRVYL